MFLNLGNSVLNNYVISTVLNIEKHLQLFGLIFELNKLRILNGKKCKIVTAFIYAFHQGIYEILLGWIVLTLTAHSSMSETQTHSPTVLINLLSMK